MTLEINTEFECLNKDFELDIEPTTAFALSLLEKVKADNDETEENIKAHTEKSVTALKANAANAIKGRTILSPSISLKDLNISPLEHELKVICKSSTTTDFSKVKVLAFNDDLIKTVSVREGVGSGTRGDLYSDGFLATTDFIKVKPNKDYIVIWNYTRWLCIYDENKNFIAQYNQNSDNNIVNNVFMTPDRAKYIRVTFQRNGTCSLFACDECETYIANADGTVKGIMSTIPYTNLVSLAEGVSIQVEYNIDTNAKTAELEEAIKNNEEKIKQHDKSIKNAESGLNKANANMDGMNKTLGIHTAQIAGIDKILKAIQTMSIDVDRPTGNTITVEPETIYMCDSGNNDNLICFTQDSDSNKYTGRIVLMIVGKEYQDQSTLAYVVTLTKGVLSPTYNAWSFYARRKDIGYNTKISFPDGSSIVKIKNVAKG